MDIFSDFAFNPNSRVSDKVGEKKKEESKSLNDKKIKHFIKTDYLEPDESISVSDELNISQNIEIVEEKNETMTNSKTEYDLSKQTKYTKSNDPRPELFRYCLPAGHKDEIIKEFMFVPPPSEKK